MLMITGCVALVCVVDFIKQATFPTIGWWQVRGKDGQGGWKQVNNADVCKHRLY